MDIQCNLKTSEGRKIKGEFHKEEGFAGDRIRKKFGNRESEERDKEKVS